MKHHTEKSAQSVALSDIRRTIFNTNNHEVWYVTASHLDDVETRTLNRELGLHKVNKQKSLASCQ